MVATSLYIATLPSVIYNGFGTTAQTIDPRTIPFLFGGYLPLNIYLMESVPAPPSTFPFNIIPTNGLQLFVYISNGIAGGTAYTWLVNWATDQNNQYFIGNLPMNTVGLQTLLGGNTSANAFLNIAYVQNGILVPVGTFAINIAAGPPIGNVQAPPGLTPMYAEVANATYVPLQPKPGQGIKIASKNNKIGQWVLVDNPDGSTTLDFQRLN